MTQQLINRKLNNLNTTNIIERIPQWRHIIYVKKN